MAQFHGKTVEVMFVKSLGWDTWLNSFSLLVGIFTYKSKKFGNCLNKMGLVTLQKTI